MRRTLPKKQQKVQDYLLDMICSGMRPGDQLPTVVELSNVLQVSQMTIHNAVNGLVESGALHKIRGKGTFVGRKPTQSRSGGSGSKPGIAFVTPFLPDDNFMRQITDGMLERTDHQRFTIMVRHVWIPKLDESVAIQETAEQFDGLIIWSGLGQQVTRTVGELLRANYPLVFIDNHPIDMHCCSVTTDNEDGIEQALEYLKAKGHKRICYIRDDGSANCSSAIERLEAYSFWMKRNNLAAKTINRLDEDICDMSAKERPTALLAHSDGIAVAWKKHLESKGLSVPADVSIIGFNDDEGMEDVGLTTVAQAKRRMGAKASELMMGILDGKNIHNQRVVLQPRLITRDTVQDIS